ncbi:MAG: hypothetical protein U5J83_18230 [Bryobacterales bacterium]|nr:hypothetical protein [Bryobacterales bacterium]
MKHTILVLAFAFVALLGAQSKPQTFTGVITDTMCGKDHAHMGISPDAKCVRECVRTSNGKFKYALWDGKKMYVLSDQKAPEAFAAQQVKVTGTLYEKTGIIKVDRIEAAPANGVWSAK